MVIIWVIMCFCKWVNFVTRLEDFDGEEVDEEAIIEQRRQQRLAIVQVSSPSVIQGSRLTFLPGGTNLFSLL